jgi:hypothetical protein
MIYAIAFTFVAASMPLEKRVAIKELEKNIYNCT